MKKINRKEFLAEMTVGGLGFLIMGTNAFADINNDLSVVVGDDPGKSVRKAIELLGGIKRYVKSGSTVLIKPNASWNRTPELAVNTNPDVVGAVVSLCRQAGAKKVIVADNTLHDAEKSYVRNGIGEAVRKAGGEIVLMEKTDFVEVDMKGELLNKWPVYKGALDADVIINIPIAKHHFVSKVTFGMKNLMGLIDGDRGSLHNNIDQAIVDMANFFKPQLTIIDAYRIMYKNGPKGNGLNDVKLTRTIIASHDIVAADSRAARLFGLKGTDIPHIIGGGQIGLGTHDLSKIKTKETKI